MLVHPLLVGRCPAVMSGPLRRKADGALITEEREKNVETLAERVMFETVRINNDWERKMDMHL